MKVNVAIELLDKNLHGIDMSHPEDGNPGMGGSEWLFVMLARYLQKKYRENYRITIYHYSDCKIPDGIRNIKIKSEDDLLEKLGKSDEQIIVHQITKSAHWYNNIEKINIADVPWAHCYIKYDEVIAINACSHVKRVVFVGKEEYDSYIDDDIIKKSTYIYNMVNVKKETKVRGENYSKTVTYMGSLVPAKAFHMLAEIWPQVEQQVPDAKLQIIGTGKLYDRDAKLGRFGIAQEDYENYFMQYLTDAEGNIRPSVRFLGLVGEEKEDYFVDTSVGVVNPSGIDETFCLSAVEMELCGVPIIARKKYGLLDTVIHQKTGLLFRNRKQFLNATVKLLKDTKMNSAMGKSASEFVKNSFDADMIIEVWHQMFQEINSNKEPLFCKPHGNYGNDLKWLRVFIKWLRLDLQIRCIPSVNHLKFIIKKRIMRR